MRNKYLFTIAFFAFFVIAQSCSNSYRAGSVVYQNYRVNTSLTRDTILQSVLRPYSDSVNGTMNVVIGVADQSLEKKMPECTLGYFMADAYLTMAKQKFKTDVDVAFMNYGGIRLTQLPAGNITIGKIFELMPFDNVLILQRMKGAELQVLLDHIAGRGGWPVAGMTMQIKNKKALNVMIGGKPLDPSATYTTANSDFVANGGDDAAMLRSIPQQNIGYLMRDAIFDYIKLLKSQGKRIQPTTENRVTNAE
jgi:2',3'-cyclic-nucleotide 2'-phosphodiesterase (5'-nucleotidase family)